MNALLTSALDILALLLIAAGLGLAVAGPLRPGLGLAVAGLIVAGGSFLASRAARGGGS